MQKSILTLEFCGKSSYRTIFKNRHGRELYLSVQIINNSCTITDCFYTDRNQGKSDEKRYNAKPKLLKTLSFPMNNLLNVISAELDKQFYGVELVENETVTLSLHEYLFAKTVPKKYNFLIMTGSGEPRNGIPSMLRTRLKNRLHRSIYVELEYYKDEMGVVKNCRYYDRNYERGDINVSPPMLTSIFFPYNKKGIIDLINNEICCNFTHIIITEEIDIETDKTPLCGSI